jgi:trans-2,3-dihydro-3-hydroxyanthranilate isomerase
MNIHVKKIHAFTQNPSGGNPAGVVPDIPPNITETQMKQISQELNVSETAYLFPSKQANVKVRFFSPETEVDLCGHATIATFFSLAWDGKFPRTKPQITVTQETNTGILPVDVYFKDKICQRVMMTQAKPIIKDVKLDVNKLAAILDIKPDDIDDSLPQQIVSTGLFTLPISIRTLTAMKTMQPDFTQIKQLCTQIGVGSMHVFTFETLEPHSTYHARNFPPLYGINEDPVTGTANGAVTSYLIKNNIITDRNIVCEQGDIIGRPGRVFVEVDNDRVRVGGKAILVEEKELNVD